MKIYKKPAGYEGVGWIILAPRAAVKWRDLVKTLTKITIQKISLGTLGKTTNKVAILRIRSQIRTEYFPI
jgi:hypothetical protein